MPMDRESHENLLTELLNPELDQSRRTDILQELRVDYGGVITDVDTLTKSNEKFSLDNADLVVANSKLFRQVGYTSDTDDMKKKDEEQNFSNTITLESIEK